MPWVGFDDYMAKTENGLASFTIYDGVGQVLGGGTIAWVKYSLVRRGRRKYLMVCSTGGETLANIHGSLVVRRGKNVLVELGERGVYEEDMEKILFFKKAFDTLRY